MKNILISYFEKAEPMPGDLAGVDNFGTFGEKKHAVITEDQLQAAKDCPRHEDVKVLCDDLPEEFAEAPHLRAALEIVYPALLNARSYYSLEATARHNHAVKVIRTALRIEGAEPMEGGA